MRITAVQACKAHLERIKGSLESVVIVEFYPKRWRIRGGPDWASRTVEKAVKECGLIGIPGYNAAFNAPVGSTIYVWPNDLIKYGLNAPVSDKAQ